MICIEQLLIDKPLTNLFTKKKKCEQIIIWTKLKISLFIHDLVDPTTHSGIFFFTPSIPLSDFAWFAIFGLKSGLLQFNWLCQTLYFLVTLWMPTVFILWKFIHEYLTLIITFLRELPWCQNSGWKKIKSNLQELQQDS